MQHSNITQIYSSKLIVSCDGNVNNSPHPLVYLNLSSGEHSLSCPYCGIEYIYRKNSEDMNYKQKAD